MKLVQEQIDLGAMYLASSNTGLVGIVHKKPTNKGAIVSVYNNVSQSYLEETGEGLDEELAEWKHDLEDDNPEFIEILKKEVPFLFEVASGTYPVGTEVRIVDGMSYIGREAAITRVISTNPISYELDIGGGHWLHSSLKQINI